MDEDRAGAEALYGAAGHHPLHAGRKAGDQQPSREQERACHERDQRPALVGLGAGQGDPDQVGQPEAGERPAIQRQASELGQRGGKHGRHRQPLEADGGHHEDEAGGEQALPGTPCAAHHRRMVRGVFASDRDRAYTRLMFFRDLFKSKMPDAADTLPGRTEPIPTAERHLINDQPLKGPYPPGGEITDFALGCFWGRRRFLGGTRRDRHRGRLPGRQHAEPQLQRGLLRPDRPRRIGACGV